MNRNDNCVYYYSVLIETLDKRPFMANLPINLCILILIKLRNKTKNVKYLRMSEINPITSTSCERMTGTRVHHVEHSKKSRDPSFEHLRIYDRNSPIRKHIPNTLVGVLILDVAYYQHYEAFAFNDSV